VPVGRPHTGKTLVASVLAHELGLDLYRVDLARVISTWIGEREKNLANVFDAGEEGHVLTSRARSCGTRPRGRHRCRPSADRRLGR
jgi:hypothetical protein